MATFRKVHTSFWSDPFVESLTPEQKFFLLFLLTNEKTSQCGIYQLTMKQMVFHSGYNSDTVEKLINFFSEECKIMYDRETQEMAIKNWRKYNDHSSPKVQACVQQELLKVKSERLKSFMLYEESDAVLVNKSHRVPEALRSHILTQYGHKCQKCSAPGDVIDFIIPRHMGGVETEENLRVLCKSCKNGRPMHGEDLKKEVISDGFDYQYLSTLSIDYLYSIGTQSQKEKEKEKEEEREKEKDKEWISGWPFDMSFLHVWEDWKDYKKRERKGWYKTAKTEHAAMQHLHSLSGGDGRAAEKIVQLSIANGWQGLHPLKNNFNGNTNTSRTSISKPIPAGNVPQGGFGRP